MPLGETLVSHWEAHPADVRFCLVQLASTGKILPVLDLDHVPLMSNPVRCKQRGLEPVHSDHLHGWVLRHKTGVET